MSVGSGDAGAIGRVLAGRFRLRARIGAGRFTDVYLAYDLSESRRVIVKLVSEEILPEEWAQDRMLPTRYLEAAEKAAAVSHPHLLTIHNWGYSDLGLYVVSDYMEGGSLQGMLDARRRLSPSQVLMIGLDATRGLDHIHNQGMIHGDIRPSNILFTRRGRARLADLGTSWALTSSETGGELMARSVFSAIDAARYASPEQAHGLTPDPKSDVYSLVLVLTEALSGRVPFEADDPDYTQMAKMSRQLDLAGQFGRLGRVLELAGRPERDDRPTARDLGQGLMAAAKTLSRPDPLPLARPEPEIPEPGEPFVPATPSRPQLDAEPTTRGGTEPHELSVSAGSPGSPRPKRRSGSRVLLALFALVALGAVGLGAYLGWDNWFGTEAQPVPDLSAATDADLLRIETEFGWVLDRREQRQNDTAAGEVLRQDPPAGTELEAGETITVWISLGPELVSIPAELIGLALEDAEDALTAVGLSAGGITERFDEAALEGVVVEVDEMLLQLEPGSRVDLVVSLGPAPRVVPDLTVGMSLVAALEQLEKAGLNLLEWRVADNEVPAGRVVRVEPPPGTEVPADFVVTLVVSDGPEQVRVPALATLSAGDARDIIETVGLCLGVIEGPLGTEVLASNPPAETVVDYGTCVSLITRPEEELEE